MPILQRSGCGVISSTTRTLFTPPCKQGTAMPNAEMNAWVARVLGLTSLAPTSSPGSVEKPVGLVQFAKLRLAWDAAKKRVAADLAQLRKTVLAEFADDPLSASLERLNEVLDHFQTGLGDRLDNLANAATPQARNQAAKASETIAAEYFAYVQTNPLIDLVETNPFMDIVISGSLSGPLTEIRRALRAVPS
jgi:hypothetical protein